MLVVHHLGRSQSERIIWLCEELGLPYELKRYEREPAGAAPAAYKALHFFGTAPVIHDGDVTLGESNAIVEYICQKYGGSQLTVSPSASNYAQYLYWLHFANGTFVPAAMMAMAAPVQLVGLDEAQRKRMQRMRWDRAYEMVEKRLGEAPYFAGSEFTAADIMMVMPMTSARRNVPYDISARPNILAYLRRIATRPAYQRAMKKADPDLEPFLT